jgi:5-oxoprolinase (ATP-hydrolysing)
MGWQFWIDRGGTFTDIVAKPPSGPLRTHKLLSDNPGRYRDAALAGMRALMGIEPDQPLPAGRIEAVKMGTTVATNALLERTGKPVLLVTTQGFRDALRIGYQARPNLFDRHIVLPEMLYAQVLEIPERVTAKGEILTPLDLNTAREGLKAAYGEGLRAVAVVFMHGYRYTDHEQKVAALAREIGFEQISVSHETSPLMKFVGRGDTTVVDAYLSPIIEAYVARIAAELNPGGTDQTDAARLMFMQSNGGLTAAHLFRGKDAILSGPAGGVVGAVETANMAGFDKIIGFDMGGTSTDVCHYDGILERTYETRVAGVRVRAPMMLIHTVAAGGGSKLAYETRRLRVGPDSAGADPGPVCYRNGGPLAVTDANVMCGKLDADYFPAIFGPGGDQPIDVGAVARAFGELAAEIGDGRTPEQVAGGFIEIAVQNMASAIKKISIERGYDVTGYALACFGGAGGQHACLVADALGMTKILIHPLSGILSAYGMGLADIRALRQRAIELPLGPEAKAAIDQAQLELAPQNRDDLKSQGVAASQTTTQLAVHIRYAGTDTALEIVTADTEPAHLKAQFEAAHKQRFGFIDDSKELVVEAVGVETLGGKAEIDEPELPLAQGTPKPDKTTRFFASGNWHKAPVYLRKSFKPGMKVDGPALVIEDHQTIVIEPGWQAELTTRDHVVLSRIVALERTRAIGTDADPVMLEIFNNLFMSIAEQMGVTLQNTAYSVNIKERLDFSCAVFDASGQLVANAPHMPVHLGSMDRSVETVIEQNRGNIRPGDVYMLNAPYNGGTHLPDITVITPVFDDAGDDILFFVASRGHHADVGGITPGSMSPNATTVDQEGVLIDNFKLVDKGRFRENALDELLASGAWPARNPAHNIADIKAQIAANEKGLHEIRNMIGHFGHDVVEAYMGHVQDNAAESVARAITALKSGSFELEMDQGAVIRVKITLDQANRTAKVDFTGTSPQQNTNFNAPRPVTRAAVLYVFRCMVDDLIPMNAGCLRPIEIVVPEGSLLSPDYPAAVVAGNVETSQAVTNALFGALGTLAAAQGTMNNLTFGNDQYQYYETICGGSGAGPGFDGTAAVHTHMTNSRLTDPEILEWRFPVLLESFEIRPGSGGAGKWRGGDGTIRTIRFLETLQMAILSGHRRVPPFGLDGGEPGQCGVNRVRRKTGRIEPLEGCDQTILEAGDAIIVQTPTGGGFGKP